MLIGFLSERYRALGIAREYTEQREYARTLAALAAALPEAERVTLMAHGAAYTEDEAIEEALAIVCVRNGV